MTYVIIPHAGGFCDKCTCLLLFFVLGLYDNVSAPSLSSNGLIYVVVLYQATLHGPSAQNTACMHYSFWQALACV